MPLVVANAAVVGQESGQRRSPLQAAITPAQIHVDAPPLLVGRIIELAGFYIRPPAGAGVVSVGQARICRTESSGRAIVFLRRLRRLMS
jgi:hypothetical protein